MFGVIMTNEKFIDGAYQHEEDSFQWHYSTLRSHNPRVMSHTHSSMINPSLGPQMFETMKFSQRNSKYLYGPHSGDSGDMVFSPLNNTEQTKGKCTVNTSGQRMEETETITTCLLSDRAITGGNTNKPTAANAGFDKSDESADSLSESSYSQHSDTSQSTTDAKSFNSSSTDLANYLLNKHQGVPRANTNTNRQGNGAIDRDEAFTKTVAMLMKVIIHLRQGYPTAHVYHMRDRSLESPSLSCRDTDTRTTRSLRTRTPKRISFSPKTLLFSAVAEKSYTEVKSILETADIDVNSKSPSGQSLLHIAAANADLRVSQLLLQYGASVKNKDSNGWSPLHAAVRRGNWKCAILLVEAGSDIAEYAQGRIQEFNDMLRKSRTCYKSVEIFV